MEQKLRGKVASQTGKASVNGGGRTRPVMTRKAIMAWAADKLLKLSQHHAIDAGRGRLYDNSPYTLATLREVRHALLYEREYDTELPDS